MGKRLKVLIWHIHGSYLNLIVHAPHDFYLPVKPDFPEGYGGRGKTFTWPDNAREVNAEDVRKLPLDLIVFQSPKNFLEDHYEILSEEQRRLPKVYLEHNTPKEHPTDTKHLVDDPNILLVHVTHFNQVMWDCGRTPTAVVEHAALEHPDLTYTGELSRGMVVVNDIRRRQRVCGLDIWDYVNERVPLDLYGFNSLEIGGFGDVSQIELLRREVRYRFFFNPIRYTSFPLAVVEAMMLGVPVVALATTELPTVIENGTSGFVSNDVDYLVRCMEMLLEDQEEAHRIGANARSAARKRFNIERFARDWDTVFQRVTS